LAGLAAQDPVDSQAASHWISMTARAVQPELWSTKGCVPLGSLSHQQPVGWQGIRAAVASQVGSEAVAFSSGSSAEHWTAAGVGRAAAHLQLLCQSGIKSAAATATAVDGAAARQQGGTAVVCSGPGQGAEGGS
jgi:hypothetical protein